MKRENCDAVIHNPDITLTCESARTYIQDEKPNKREYINAEHMVFVV